MKRRLILAAVLLGAAWPALAGIGSSRPAGEEQAPQAAQTGGWIARLARGYVRGLTEPNRRLDSTWVYQPATPWSIGWENTRILAGVEIRSAIRQTVSTEGGVFVQDASYEDVLQRRPYLKVGSTIAYGNQQLTYGVDVSQRSGERNTFFSFAFLRPAYGFDLQYYKIMEPVEGQLQRTGVDVFPLVSKRNGTMRSFSLDGFYAFNDRHFAFTAAYLGNVIQRRSAGSWMVTAKYLQGDLRLKENNAYFLALTGGLELYSTQQVSLGGGYSYNWVILHRQPGDNRSRRGLRNLTFNATLLPMASFYNHIEAATGEIGTGSVRYRFNGWPALAVNARAALAVSWNRFSLRTQLQYNRFGFYGVQRTFFSGSGETRTDTNTRAVFDDLTARLQLAVHF